MLTQDVHNRLMQSYPLVPQSWYLSTLVLSLGAAIVLVMTTPLQFPVRYYADVGVGLAALRRHVALFPDPDWHSQGSERYRCRPECDYRVRCMPHTDLSLVSLFPASQSEVRVSTNPDVCWKCYGYMSCAQALDMIGDLKLAHYMSTFFLLTQKSTPSTCRYTD